jgi:hypothetical protein
MTAPALDQNSITTGPFATISSLAFSLSATQANEVIVVFVAFSVNTAGGITLPQVTAITGGGLTFQRLVGPSQITGLPTESGGTGNAGAELWWANAPTAFGATTFTATFSQSFFNDDTTAVGILAAGISGCSTPSAPWDTTPGLPAIFAGAAPATLTFNTVQRSDIVFTTGAPAPGSVVWFANALVGTNGDELLLMAVLDSETGTAPPYGPSSPNSLTFGTVATSWSGNMPGVFQDLVYGPPPAPPAPPTASTTLAELFFTSTGSFVDLSVAANRRKFISDLGGAPSLGADGSVPLNASPPVFLSAASGNPDQFAANNGRGGAFVLSASGAL